MAASWLDRMPRACCVVVAGVTNLSIMLSASASFWNIFCSVPKVKISWAGKRRPCLIPASFWHHQRPGAAQLLQVGSLGIYWSGRRCKTVKPAGGWTWEFSPCLVSGGFWRSWCVVTTERTVRLYGEHGPLWVRLGSYWFLKAAEETLRRTASDCPSQTFQVSPQLWYWIV